MYTYIFDSESKEGIAGRVWLIGLLQERNVEIVFTKKDGSERLMNCTLKEGVIPAVTKSERKYSEEALPVFDVDVKEWRSFRWDAIKSVKFNLE
jgi:hypothetical protein